MGDILKALRYQYSGLDADKSNVVEPNVMDTYYATDTMVLYWYTGTAWNTCCRNDIPFLISDFVESIDGGSNDVDVAKLVDTTNNKVGKRVTGNDDNQDVDFDILVYLPKNFIEFAANAISIDLRASDITGNNVITGRVYGTDGNEVGAGFTLTPSSGNTWQTKVITKANLTINGEVFAAEQFFRIRIHVAIDDADTIDISAGVVKFK